MRLLLFTFHFSLFTLCILFLLSTSSAQEPTNQPPQAPVTGLPAEVTTPPELAPPSPVGETPHEPSKPPTGYEPKPAPTVEVTGGVSVPVDNNILKLDADFWRVDFAEGEAVSVSARGNVRATYREFEVTSSTATVDLHTKIATFSENVILKVRGQDVRGSQLTINLGTREWSFQTARSDLRPEFFPGIIQAPVFLSGDLITGMADRIVTVENGGFTTCNLDHPHYFIDAGTATVWPGHKLVARDATFFALGRRIFRLARLAIPLRQIRERPNLFPRIGQTQEEGFFLKAAYSLAANLSNSANLNLDLMSRKGIGIGLDDNYSYRGAVGNLNIYRLTDRNRNLNTLTGRLTYQQQLGTVQANLTSDYRSNSFMYAPESTSIGSQLQFTRNRPGAFSMLGIRQSTDRGFGSFSMLTSNLQHNQTFSKTSSANFGFDYFRSSNPFQSGDSTLDLVNSQLVSRADYRRQAKLFDWNLRLNKINDLSNEAFISQSGTRFAGTERLPELELVTSTDRLKKNLPGGLPAQLGLAVGRYREDLGRIETERAVVNVEVPSQTYKLADKLNLSTGAGLRQYIYGNNTAQYSFDAAAELTRQLGEKSNAALSYRYLRPRGFTPFRFDFIGRYNVLNASLNWQETKKFKAGLFTGYDFQQEEFPWQDITARILYAPNDRYLLYTSTGYDLNLSRWRALINQVRVRLPHDFKLDVGTRYDFDQNKFASIKTQLDTPIGDKWRVRALTGYNGFTKNFDYRNFQLVRDLHCWELSLSWVDQTGFWQERGLRLNLRIKAFPIFDRFGVGQFGQALDTSVGEVL